jgi:hypothetical protein
VVPQPRGSKLPWFGLFRVRSPLLTESRLISIPAGTEMFQFPALASFRMTKLAPGRVSPFGHPEITARVQLPQAYRSLPRPSSPLDAKASTVCLIAFDLTTSWGEYYSPLHLFLGVDSFPGPNSNELNPHNIPPSVVKELKVKELGGSDTARATPEAFRRTSRYPHHRWYGRMTCAPYSAFQKGGDPAAGSPTATLLRLRPSH